MPTNTIAAYLAATHVEVVLSALAIPTSAGVHQFTLIATYRPQT